MEVAGLARTQIATFTKIFVVCNYEYNTSNQVDYILPS